MRDFCTNCTHAKPLDHYVSKTTHDEKLEFVEHVLGVLVQSRHGDENPYVRIGQRMVTTGHSQMFANVRLLTVAEIGAHLEFGAARQSPGFGPAVLWAKAREVLEMLIRRLKPTAIQRDQNNVSSAPRGSPTFLGRSSSRLPLRT